MAFIQSATSNDNYWNKWLMKWFVCLLIPGIAINVAGLFTTILEPDGALYAMIAKTMVNSGDYINLRVEGKDWLDKPHFPFWATAASFHLFGINTLAYKLPALVFWLLGACYTYLLAKALYSRNVAMLAVLIYMTAAHLVISNNDVRAEPYLTGMIIGSVFHFYKASHKGFSLHLVVGSILAACAVMTKGPFVLIIIGSGFIADWMLKKEWHQFVHYRWWLAFFLVLVFILPEIYCLYEQFDSHPEKVVFGHNGVSGIRFFFWDSQFGRFLNTGPIKGKGDVLFYVHTLVWAFLPWSILLFRAVLSRLRNLKGREVSTSEAITIGASLTAFLLFSLSGFQLPHYMNIVFPFFSIITAQFVYGIHRKKAVRVWVWVHNIFSFLLIIALMALTIYFGFAHPYLITGILLAAFIITWYVFSKNGLGPMFGRIFLTAVLLYGFLNVAFYPAILNYQSGSKAAAFINMQQPGHSVYTYLENSYSFAFYLNRRIEYVTSPEMLKAGAIKKPILVYTSRNNLEGLIKTGLTITVLGTFPNFHISQLTGKFLNGNKRQDVTTNMIVAKISIPDISLHKASRVQLLRRPANTMGLQGEWNHVK